MSTKPTIAIVLLGIGLTATSLASIINTTRLNHLSMRCDDIEARLAACPSQTVRATYGYATRTHGGSGLCVYDHLREQVAPGSRGRELTPDEEAAFIKATEAIGVGTTIVKRKGERP